MTDYANINDILNNISSEYNIPINDLMKYSTKKKTKKLCICKARKHDGQQCTRKSKNNSIFCGKHMLKRNFGCVSDELYIECSFIKEDDKEYCVDDYGILYQKIDNDKYKIVGIKNNNGVKFL